MTSDNILQNTFIFEIYNKKMWGDVFFGNHFEYTPILVPMVAWVNKSGLYTILVVHSTRYVILISV